MRKVKVNFKLKDVLEERKMTQKELAQKSGVREATISDIVRGTRTVINFKHLSDIASALEIIDIREIMDFVNADDLN